ncbi:hypothetical protein LXL04_028558 [Taraxacum kok-saghyz]
MTRIVCHLWGQMTHICMSLKPLSSLKDDIHSCVMLWGTPHDAPATVLFGEWFRFGKPSDHLQDNKEKIKSTSFEISSHICFNVTTNIHHIISKSIIQPPPLLALLTTFPKIPILWYACALMAVADGYSDDKY